MKNICEYCKVEYEWDGQETHQVEGKKRGYKASKFCSYECYKANKVKNTKAKWLEKYGVENPQQCKEVKKKTQSTMIKKYGTIHALQIKEFQDRMKDTCLERYGVENAAQSNIIQDRMKDTCLERYGVQNCFQSEEKKAKIVQTSIKKYGTKSPIQNKDIKQKALSTMVQKYGAEYPLQSKEIQQKVEATNLEKYGVKHAMQLGRIQNKRKKSNLEKYGAEEYFQSEQHKQMFLDKDLVRKTRKKAHETMKVNGTYGKSKKEDQIYEILMSKFNIVERQYSSEKYPFNADFYIPGLDLYIEYNGFWHHGKEPFDINNMRHMHIVKKWQDNKGPQYTAALDTWTIRDPHKRKVAHDNKIKLLEFWSVEEVIKWLVY